MKIVNQLNYVPKQGRKVKGKTLTQLAEYQPLQKMLANLTIAGLNASARQAMDFYDSHRGPDDVDIPLLPRHISPDITDVHRVSQYFAAKKQEIEDRVRSARELQVEKLRAAQQAGSSPPSGGPGSGAGQAPTADKP